jgi:hypothetical protein
MQEWTLSLFGNNVLFGATRILSSEFSLSCQHGWLSLCSESYFVKDTSIMFATVTMFDILLYAYDLTDNASIQFDSLNQ